MLVDEKTKRLEKRIAQIEKTTNKNFQRVEEAFASFREVLLKMHHENEQLKKDRKFLLDAYKMQLKNIPQPSLRKEIKKNLIGNARKKVRRNFELVRNIAAEGLVESRIDELFELVFLEGKIRSGEVSRRLDIHEKQVEEWAKKLESMDLIEIRPFKGQLVLIKRE